MFSIVFTAAAFHMSFLRVDYKIWGGIFACASEFGSFTIMFVMRALVKNNNDWCETPEESWVIQECILKWGTLASFAVNTNWKANSRSN